eukprot:scaffold33997_cov65-Phaeocystis_antarctica.AAC.3
MRRAVGARAERGDLLVPAGRHLATVGGVGLGQAPRTLGARARAPPIPTSTRASDANSKPGAHPLEPSSHPVDGPAAPAGPHDQHGGLVPIADHVRPGPPRALQPGVHLDLRKVRAAASAGWGGTEMGERRRALAPHPEPTARSAAIFHPDRVCSPQTDGGAFTR